MRLELRASEAFLRRLDAFAQERGLNRSEAVRAAVLEASPDAPPLPPAPDRDELLRLLGEAARAGSVPAIRRLLDELREPGEPRAESSMIERLARERPSNGHGPKR